MAGFHCTYLSGGMSGVMAIRVGLWHRRLSGLGPLCKSCNGSSSLTASSSEMAPLSAINGG